MDEKFKVLPIGVEPTCMTFRVPDALTLSYKILLEAKVTKLQGRVVQSWVKITQG